MSCFQQNAFIDFLIEYRIVGFFKHPIQLKSGRMSNWYVNWRTISGDAYLMNRLIQFVIAYVHEHQLTPDAFYGVPEGATKLGVLCSHEWAKLQDDYMLGKYSLPMGRAKPKPHGDPKDRFFVGAPEGNIIVLEDVTTTGLSLGQTLDQLASLNVSVMAAIGLTNRNEIRDDGQSVQEYIESKGVPYMCLSHAHDFLPIACQQKQPGHDIQKAIEEEFDKYGVMPMHLDE